MWFVADRRLDPTRTLHLTLRANMVPSLFLQSTEKDQGKFRYGATECSFRFAFSCSKVSLSFVVFDTPPQINLCKPIRGLTMKNPKISRFARPTLTPTFSTLNGPPLTETPNPLETSDHLSPKPQTPDRFSPKPGLDSPYFNPSIRYVAHSAIATCTLDLVICTLEHTFSAFWL